MWIDPKLDLPVRIVARHTDKNIVTVEFTDLRINTGLKPKSLWVDEPRGYSYAKESLSQLPR